MSGKPHFLISLLIGSLTLSISIAAINELSKSKAGSSESVSISRPALTVKAHVPEDAANLDLPKETIGQAAAAAESDSAVKTPAATTFHRISPHRILLPTASYIIAQGHTKNSGPMRVSLSFKALVFITAYACTPVAIHGEMVRGDLSR